MESSYKYEVYFECPNIDEVRKGRIEKYFQVRRKSDGGDCGRMEVVQGNVYKIAFQHEEDQRRVLLKREHGLSGSPRIIVHKTMQSLLQEGLSPITAAAPEADHPKGGLSSPPEHEVHLEGGTHHLKEPLLARKHLEEQLPSTGVLAQIQRDKDIVVVTGQGHPDADGFTECECQAADKVDIVGHVQEQPAETELSTAKLDESETGSVDKLKNTTKDIPSSTVQHSSRRYEETQRGPLSDQPVTRDGMGSAARQIQGGKTKHQYALPDGVCVLVCHGDITKESADALVNAANRYLDHAGGVAGALSRAGGSAVQQESTALVRQHGPYATGAAVMTSGGNLQCKKLIHIVGPVQGEAQGQEKALLQRSVWSALTLADEYRFRSIAMPCISSGIFQVPIAVCAEAIVTAVKRFGKQSLFLRKITLIDTREEVVRALEAACDRILSPADEELETAGGRQFQESTEASGPWSNSGASPVNTGTVGSTIQLKTMLGVIETQQVDVIVSPMKDHDPRSTPLGRRLSEMIGPSVDTAFRETERDCPTVEVDVDGLHAFCCRKVLFVSLLPWNGQHADEAAVQVLKRGLQHVLSFCQKQAFGSVAFPMPETSNVLQFPPNVAESVLGEEIRMLQQHGPNRTPLVVHIVAQPRTTETDQAMPPQQTFTPHRNTAPRASFCSYAVTSREEVTAMVGKVQLQLVRQDIVSEKTDVIVNTISANSKQQTGVSMAILKAAGSLVTEEFLTKLAACADQNDVEYSTPPGNLQCKTIIHATFYGEQKIRSTCENILKICESKHYSSVSFPALGTGTAELDPIKACNAMLDGFEEAVRSMEPTSLSVVRIVVFRTGVYKEFSKVLQNRCEGGSASRQEGARAHQEFQRHGPPNNTHSPSSAYSSSHATCQHHSSTYDNTWCNYL